MIPIMNTPGARLYLLSNIENRTAEFHLVINTNVQDAAVLKLVGSSDRGSIPSDRRWRRAPLDPRLIEDMYFESSYAKMRESLIMSGAPTNVMDTFTTTVEKKLDPDFEHVKRRTFFWRIERGIGTKPSTLQLCVHQRVALNTTCISKMASVDGGYALEKMFPATTVRRLQISMQHPELCIRRATMDSCRL